MAGDTWRNTFLQIEHEQDSDEPSADIYHEFLFSICNTTNLIKLEIKWCDMPALKTDVYTALNTAPHKVWSITTM